MKLILPRALNYRNNQVWFNANGAYLYIRASKLINTGKSDCTIKIKKNLQ